MGRRSGLGWARWALLLGVVALVAAVKGLLNTLQLHHTDEGAMEVATRIRARLQQPRDAIDVKDLLVGAIALVNGSPVVTGNQRPFQRIEGLEVRGPDEAPES